MTEEAQSKAKLFYGWWIVGAAFTTLLLTGGIISYTFGIFFIFDVTQGYFWAFIAGVGLIALATIAIFFVRGSPMQERH